MNIFELARLELKREGKLEAANAGSLLIDRAIAIRKALDISEERKEAARVSWEKRRG